MGLRLRKSFPFGKLFRLNLSKSGVSIGIGPPGLNVNIGPRGIRRTVGLPGTGVYYQDTERWPKPSGDERAGSSEPRSIGVQSNGEPGMSMIRLLVYAGIVLLVLSGISSFFGSGAQKSSSPAPASAPSVLLPSTVTPPASTSDRPLTRDEIRELQTLLRRQGFATGPIDGIDGPRTRLAIAAFRKARGLPGASEPTHSTLDAARSR